MQAAASTPGDALAFYEEHGYWIEPNVLSDAECEAYIAAGMGLKQYKETGSTRPAMMPHRENPIFVNALKHPKVVSMIETFVGGTADGLQTEFFYCKPGTKGFSLHQDNFFVEAPMGKFASAWMALTDTYAEKGGLIVYPGTHKEGLLPVKKIFIDRDAGQDPNANNEEAIVPPQYKPINAKVPKGAVLFIHGHIVHGSNPNATSEWRYVLLDTYIKRGEPFRPGQYANRAQINLHD